MDVNVTWQQLAEAVENDDWNSAEEHADALMSWLARGGFPPEITGHRTFDAIVAKQTCEGICAWDI